MSRTDSGKMSMWIDLVTKAEIERLAAKIGVTPSTLCRNLVVVGLQETQTMEKVGILQAAVFLQELRERMRKRVEVETERVQGALMAT